MTVESANFIPQLNDALPAASDTRTEGDDHIKLIKTAVKGSFPNLGNTAVTSTAAELNILDGVTASTAELNILDGVTASAAELNRMDGNVGNSNASSVQATLGIYSGYVPSTGVGERVPNGWSALKTATGTYTVTHSLGLGNANDLNITVTPVVGVDEYIANISATTTNSFTVKTYETTLTVSEEDAAWHFTAINRTA